MNYASIEYSKELAELFDDVEWWWCDENNELQNKEPSYYVIRGRHDCCIPALTTDDLLGKLPETLESKTYWYEMTLKRITKDWCIFYYCDEKKILHQEDNKSLPNALAKMLCYLKTNGLLNELNKSS